MLKSRAAIGLVLLLLAMLIVPAYASDYRTSSLADGWQIWIPAGNFTSKTDAVKLGSEYGAPTEGAISGGEILVLSDAPDKEDFDAFKDAYAAYEFESPVEGDAYLYVRTRDLRPDGDQSLFLVLNSDSEWDSLIPEPGDDWIWATGRDLGSLSPIPLKKGKNTLYVVRREGEKGKEVLVDAIVVSSVDLEPTDDMFKAAK